MMAAASVLAKDTLLVGDSKIDLETAQRAGVRCCLVSYGFGFRDQLRMQSGSDVFFAADATELTRAIDAFVS